MNCEHCGEYVVLAGIGQRPRFCSTRCRVASHRTRKSLPKAMTARESWVRADGKRPIQPNGRAASSTNVGTWHSFTAVQSGAGDGYGIMLGGGLGCWDLDDCFDGDDLKPWAAEILDAETPIYVERSVSGHGLHIFIEAPEGPGRKRGRVERYTKGRFIRVTGNQFS